MTHITSLIVGGSSTKRICRVTHTYPGLPAIRAISWAESCIESITSTTTASIKTLQPCDQLIWHWPISYPAVALPFYTVERAYTHPTHYAPRPRALSRQTTNEYTAVVRRSSLLFIHSSTVTWSRFNSNNSHPNSNISTLWSCWCGQSIHFFKEESNVYVDKIYGY